jgi:endo-1,4-beta-xylanase
MLYRTFHSATIDAPVSYLVYLPPSYESSPDRRYPVVYWLHGRGGTQTGARHVASRVGPASAAGKAPEMIVIGVNGLRVSSYVDAAHGKAPVQTVLTKDLVAHVDAAYRTIARREARAIEGFSMGGAGAAKVGFRHPELFGVVSAFAAAMHDLESMRGRGAAWTDIYGASEEYFQKFSPWTVVEANEDKIRGRTAVRLVVGADDNLLGFNQRYHELLERLGIEHAFVVVPGVGHTPGPLYEGLGDEAVGFYQRAFAGVQ